MKLIPRPFLKPKRPKSYCYHLRNKPSAIAILSKRIFHPINYLRNHFRSRPQQSNSKTHNYLGIQLTFRFGQNSAYSSFRTLKDLLFNRHRITVRATSIYTGGNAAYPKGKSQVNTHCVRRNIIPRTMAAAPATSSLTLPWEIIDLSELNHLRLDEYKKDLSVSEKK